MILQNLDKIFFQILMNLAHHLGSLYCLHNWQYLKKPLLPPILRAFNGILSSVIYQLSFFINCVQHSLFFFPLSFPLQKQWEGADWVPQQDSQEEHNGLIIHSTASSWSCCFYHFKSPASPLFQSCFDEKIRELWWDQARVCRRFFVLNIFKANKDPHSGSPPLKIIDGACPFDNILFADYQSLQSEVEARKQFVQIRSDNASSNSPLPYLTGTGSTSRQNLAPFWNSAKKKRSVGFAATLRRRTAILSPLF